jgi:hypothetical protein
MKVKSVEEFVLEKQAVGGESSVSSWPSILGTGALGTLVSPALWRMGTGAATAAVPFAWPAALAASILGPAAYATWRARQENKPWGRSIGEGFYNMPIVGNVADFLHPLPAYEKPYSPVRLDPGARRPLPARSKPTAAVKTPPPAPPSTSAAAKTAPPVTPTKETREVVPGATVGSLPQQAAETPAGPKMENVDPSAMAWLRSQGLVDDDTVSVEGAVGAPGFYSVKGKGGTHVFQGPRSDLTSNLILRGMNPRKAREVAAKETFAPSYNMRAQKKDMREREYFHLYGKRDYKDFKNRLIAGEDLGRKDFNRFTKYHKRLGEPGSLMDVLRDIELKNQQRRQQQGFPLRATEHIMAQHGIRAPGLFPAVKPATKPVSNPPTTMIAKQPVKNPNIRVGGPGGSMQTHKPQSMTSGSFKYTPPPKREMAPYRSQTTGEPLDENFKPWKPKWTQPPTRTIDLENKPKIGSINPGEFHRAFGEDGYLSDGKVRNT